VLRYTGRSRSEGVDVCPPGWSRLPLYKAPGIPLATVVCYRMGPRGNILVGIETAVPTGAYRGPKLPSELPLTREERALQAGLPVPPVAPPSLPAEEFPSLAELRRRANQPAPRPPPLPRHVPVPGARGETHRGVVVVIPAEAVGTLRTGYASAARGRSPLATVLRTAAYAIHNARLTVSPAGAVTGTSFIPRGPSEQPASALEALPRLAPVSYPTVLALLFATFDSPTLEALRVAHLIAPRFNNYLQSLGWSVCGRIRGSEIVIRCPPVRPPTPEQTALAAEYLERGEDVFRWRQPTRSSPVP
jgi:hypothetical protein